MGMSVGSEDDEEMIGTINTTPLVDVMLVLLIIFLITIPVVTHTVPVKLPEEKILRTRPRLKIFNFQLIRKAIFSGTRVMYRIKKYC
ncbi:hypothetical protein OCUAc20_23650 [Acinetobacter baumannii]|nr:biopolymer transport ExbD/TolR family protein [Acinetobacter baumannii 1482820]BDE23865.1 hypothetical protein OCUAc20_23650 [Acinetobacter baumannii]